MPIPLELICYSISLSIVPVLAAAPAARAHTDPGGRSASSGTLSTQLRFGAEKASVRARLGGEGTEAAVAAGLSFLATYQSSDGSWDCDDFATRGAVTLSAREAGPGQAQHDVGVTGLALLALMGDGNTSSRGTYKRAVQRGLQWLTEQQDEDASGLIGRDVGHAFLYDHAIATYALCEALALDEGGPETLRKSATRAVEYILRARNPYRAWRYDVPPVGDNDTSVTGWMVHALEAAERAGLSTDRSAREGVLNWLQDVTDVPTGRVGYSQLGEPSSRVPGINEHFPSKMGEAMTAVGLTARFLLGQDPDRDRIMDAHAELILRSLPVWDPDVYANDIYYLYHGTFAMRLMGGERWQRWNEALRTALLPTQREAPGLQGSWDPIGPWGFAGGRLYTTALAVMTLESYYRYELVGEASKVGQGPTNEAPRSKPTRVARVASIYEGRFGERKRELREQGGGEGTVDALAGALTWLAASQRDEGFWDSSDSASERETLQPILACGGTNSRIGLTSLSLLALLGDGNGTQMGPFKLAVRDGVAWLCAQQDAESGAIGTRGEEGALLDHALATLALAEAAERPESEELRGCVRMAVRFASNSRSDSGTWVGAGALDWSCDLAATGWMLLALRAAEVAGVRVEPALFADALAWMDRSTDPESGRVRPDREGAGQPGDLARLVPLSSESAVAVMLFLRQALGQRAGVSALMRRQAEVLAARPPRWSAKEGGGDLYHLLFGSFALRWSGDEAWRLWEPRLEAELLNSQRRDGELAGSWDPVGPWVSAGRCFTTAGMALALESYFRWVPVD